MATDGTAAGTRTLDFLPGGAPAPRYWHVAGGSLYFDYDSGLWRTDGTRAGTTLIEGARGIEGLISVGGHLVASVGGGLMTVAPGATEATFLAEIERRPAVAGGPPVLRHGAGDGDVGARRDGDGRPRRGAASRSRPAATGGGDRAAVAAGSSRAGRQIPRASTPGGQHRRPRRRSHRLPLARRRPRALLGAGRSPGLTDARALGE